MTVRINKEQLNALLSLPDDKLWEEVLRLGGGYGLKLPKSCPAPEQRAALRSAVNSDKIKMSDAMRILNQIKREGKK